jgi:hypothetical protein
MYDRERDAENPNGVLEWTAVTEGQRDKNELL